VNWFEPVHLAAEGGWEEVIRILLEEDSVNVNKLDVWNTSALEVQW
jgi:hypothetical protein